MSDSSDFTARTDIPVTFSSTETRQAVEVELLNDDILEGDENFMGSLSLPAGSAGLTLGVDTVSKMMMVRDNRDLILGL